MCVLLEKKENVTQSGSLMCFNSFGQQLGLCSTDEEEHLLCIHCWLLKMIDYHCLLQCVELS